MAESDESIIHITVRAADVRLPPAQCVATIPAGVKGVVDRISPHGITIHTEDGKLVHVPWDPVTRTDATTASPEAPPPGTARP